MSGALRSLALFAVAALAEIGGSYLIWRGVREGRGGWLAIAGGLLLAGYGFIATLQSDRHFGRVLAAYGGVFVAEAPTAHRSSQSIRPTTRRPE